MLFIIIGVVLAVVCWLLLVCNDVKEDTASFWAAIFVLAGLCCSVFIDFDYKEKVMIEEIELVSLDTSVVSEGSGTMFYVSVSAQKVYSYRFEKENDTGIPGRLYETETVSGNVEELESAECKKPVLLVYNHEAKGKFWFSLFAADKKSYLFYVPEGTILKDVVLE